MSVIFSLFPGLLVTTALTLRLVIISFRPAWLARDTARASSVHSLQEMTDADEGRKVPFDVARGDVRKSRAMWLTKTVDISVI